MIKQSDLEEIINLIPIPMLILTYDDLNIIKANKSFIDWSGINIDKYYGRYAGALEIWLIPEAWDYFLDNLRKTYEALAYELKLTTSDGKIHFCNLINKVYEVDGIKYLLIVMEDITRTKQVEIEKEMLYYETQETLINMTKDIEFLTDMIIRERINNKNAIIVDSKGDLPVTVKQEGKKQININGYVIELNRKELNIIGMIVEGKTTAQIASELFLAEGSIRNIITEIISKLMLKDKTQLAVFAIKNGIV
ncbi:MAG: LuxR C-terminal-related transcriptional regulator [Bacillota bacterium]|nr:LuxR C-terminal-related transcriptional regulator [Bacillota bacterium]